MEKSLERRYRFMIGDEGEHIFESRYYAQKYISEFLNDRPPTDDDWIDNKYLIEKDTKRGGYLIYQVVVI